MKIGLIVGGIVLVFTIIAFSIYGTFAGKYNTAIAMQEGVATEWANVENQYQRRADLIPNLVNTVKGYAAHEKEALQAVIEARSKATSVTIDPSNMTAEQLQQFDANQTGLASALSKLMVVVERYPDLKANQNFLQLQAQLEGTENRITVARKNFNGVAREYNTFIKQFPNNFILGWFGDFPPRPYFEAQPGTEVAPEVSFE